MSECEILKNHTQALIIQAFNFQLDEVNFIIYCYRKITEETKNFLHF